MKIVQIFQILTVSPSKIADESQTIARHFLRREKAIKGPLSIRPPTIIEEHKRTITFGCFTFETQSQLRFAFLLTDFVQNIYCSNIGGKNHFEPVLMVGGIQLAVVIKAWQRVW